MAYFRQIAPSEMVDLFSNETEIIVAEIDYLEKVSPVELVHCGTWTKRNDSY